jgi:hypothetical protein
MDAFRKPRNLRNAFLAWPEDQSPLQRREQIRALLEAGGGFETGISGRQLIEALHEEKDPEVRRLFRTHWTQVLTHSKPPLDLNRAQQNFMSYNVLYMEAFRGKPELVKEALKWGADPLFRMMEPGQYYGLTPREALELDVRRGPALFEDRRREKLKECIVLLRQAEDQARALAVGMALHSRLGAQSGLGRLGPDPLRMITGRSVEGLLPLSGAVHHG